MAGRPLPIGGGWREVPGAFELGSWVARRRREADRAEQALLEVHSRREA
jgi:hypothetical protein